MRVAAAAANCSSLPAGQQVERGGVLGRGGRLESPPVWLPVTGALVVEPLGEVVADHQVRHDRGGVLAEHRREAGLRQDVREGAAVADAVQHLAVQLGQCRLQAGDRLGGELLGQRGVAVDEQAGPQAADEGEGLQEPFRGAFAGEWLPQVGHEHVAGEQHAAGRKVDHQRVCGFPARRRVQDKLGAP